MKTQRIPASSVRQRLARLGDVLGTGDLERLERILSLFDNDPKQEVALESCLERLAPGSTVKKQLGDFRAFRFRLKDAGTKAGMRIELAVDSKKRSDPSDRRCWFTLPTDSTADHIADWVGQETASDAPYVPSYVSAGGVQFPGVLSYYVSGDVQFAVVYKKEDWRLAQKLLRRIENHAESRETLETVDFVLLLLSESWLGRQNNQDNDTSLHDLTAEDRKSVIPVALKSMDESLLESHGWEMRRLFRLRTERGIQSFDGCQGKAEKERFARELLEQIRQRLEDRRAQELLDATRPLAPRNVIRPQASKTRLNASTEAVPLKRGYDALDVLQEWVKDKDAAPYFVLLAEYGVGKTTTLQRWAQLLLSQRAEGKEAPLPIFIDLRHYSATVHRGEIPSLEILLQELLEQVWKTPNEITFTAQDILRLVREEGAVLIFDGLDEKLVHLDETQGRAFLRTLWGALPPSHRSPGQQNPASLPGKPGRLVFSCRSHYFKTLREQNAMLRGEDRDRIRADDYAPWVLLPFDDRQIRLYLARILGEERVEAALNLFASVHNLRELAPRPYLLSLMAEYVGELEQRQARGDVVQGVTLYALLVEEWLTRDGGKHRLRPEDKLQLMEGIAADMWRDGAREWPWNRVLDWLTQQLEHKAVWRTRYLLRGSLELLEEDFRTATFVLRPDDSQDRFRFAHTSLQEYFLARYLHRALAEDEPQHWDLPLPSPETLDFLGQLIDISPETRDNVLRHMEAVLEQAPTQATDIVFRYWLRATEGNLPQPAPQHVKLQGVDLSGLVIRALNLSKADLSGANLAESRFYNSDLSDADFSGVQAKVAEFHHVSARNLNLGAADLTDTTWRYSQMEGLRNGPTAVWNNSQLIGCDLARQDLPADFGRVGTLSDHRHPELSIPPRQVLRGSEVTTVLGHTDQVLACVFSPDSARVVSGAYDGTLKVWDLETGRCLRTLEGHADSVFACVFSPDGARVVSGADDGTLKVWDIETGRCLRTLEGHVDLVLACVISSDGARVVSGSGDRALKVWDLETGHCLRTLKGHAAEVGACALSPDGTRIVSGCRGALKLWDLETGHCLRTWEEHEDGICACAISSDGARIVSGARDGTFKVWDLETGRCLRTLENHADGLRTCAISPDGTRIVSGTSDGILKVWDLDTGRCLRTWEGHADGVRTCAISPDGTRIVSGTLDGTLKVWDLESGRCLRTWEEHAGSGRACAISPNGARIVAATDRGAILKVWDPKTGHCLHTWEGDRYLWTCVFSPDGARIVSGATDGTLKLWDLETGRCLLTWKGHTGGVRSCSVSPDSVRIASGGGDGTLKLWDLETGRCLFTWKGHARFVDACVFTPDGSRIVSGALDGTLKLWDLESGRCLHTWEGHTDGVCTCAISPDGTRVVSGGFQDGALKVWDMGSSGCLRTWEGHADGLHVCAISPDSTRIVSGSSRGILKVWDLETGRCVRAWEGHTGGVCACAFSPDGVRIISGSSDGTLKIWDSDSDSQMTLINGPNGETASLDYRTNRILSASSEAWRFLGWRYFDQDAQRLRILPAEHAGPLPSGQTGGRPPRESR